MYISCCSFFFSSRRRHTRCALVTGVQTLCSSDLVAQIGLRRRAEPYDRVAGGERDRLGGRHLGRVYEAPAAVDRCMAQEPFDRPGARPEIGRTTCLVRVCPYEEILVDPGSIQKTQTLRLK